MTFKEFLVEYIPPNRSGGKPKGNHRSKRYDSAEKEPITPYEQAEHQKKREAALDKLRKEKLAQSKKDKL